MKYNIDSLKCLIDENDEDAAITILVNHPDFTSIEVSKFGATMMSFDGEDMIEIDEPEGGHEPYWFMDLIFNKIEEFDYN